MKLSTRARYALRSMIAIDRLTNDGKPASLKRVSRLTRTSRRYLEQLAIGLKDAALLKGVSGRSGGYLLARPAREIKVGQIVEAAIGPIAIADCLQEQEICIQADFCECRCLYMLINERIKQVLNEYSLADLSDKKLIKQLYGSMTQKAVKPIN